MGEFDLIERYFSRPSTRVGHAVLGIGDDCALIAPAAGMQLAISSDMLVEGRHFLSTVAPDRLGHKTLAVNLSDLAACGARPLAFTLAMAMPAVDEAFLAGFARGLFALADEHGCELIGGDTTRGPLNLCVTVFGEVAPGRALLRSGAQAGDDLWISGATGDARLALEVFRGSLSIDGDSFDIIRAAMERPTPRVALGQALCGVASAAIDVSDGLLGDLRHVLKRSRVGASVDVDAVPRGAVLRAQPIAMQRLCTLSGGDDYELVFTASPVRADDVQRAARLANTPVTRIGRIDAEPGLRLHDARGVRVADDFGSFDHFRTQDTE